MINKAILVGRLGKQAELRYAGENPVANFSIATSEQWKDKQGQKQERTEWHRIVLWGKLAEVLRDSLSKGVLVYVEGTIQTRQWEKDGKTNYTTEVNCRTLRILEGNRVRDTGKRAESDGEPDAGAGHDEGPEQPSFGPDDMPF